MSESPDPKAFDPRPSDPEAADSARCRPLTSAAGASESAPPQSYQVGPGHPPRDTRWKKGGPSPNPRGRPRKDQPMLPDARKAFEQALNKKVAVARGDKQVLMTRIEIGFEQLLNQFAKGDPRARRDLMEYADKLGIDFLAPHRQVLEQALAPNYQAILDAAVARRSGAADIAPPERALAPSELLDNDESAADLPSEPDLASSPTEESKPKVPMPTPGPGMIYQKPPERMTRMELAAWYPEWYAQYGKAWEQERRGR
jgi:hypothetical protein